MPLNHSTDDVLIKPRINPQIRIFIIFSLLFCIGVLAYFTYTSGVKEGHSQYTQHKKENKALLQQNKELNVQLASVTEQKIIAQRQYQIQQEAYKQIQKAYFNIEKKNNTLSAKLDFFQSIISPKNKTKGPIIQNIIARHENHQLEFDISLIQSLHHRSIVEGQLTVTLYDNDKPIGTWPQKSARPIHYQYFQEITGSMLVKNLPKKPKLLVKLQLDKQKSIEKWHTLTYLFDKKLDSSIIEKP